MSKLLKKGFVTYLLIGFIVFFLISTIGITAEDILHKIPIIFALTAWHHFITPLILGTIGAVLGFIFWKSDAQREQHEKELAESKNKFETLYKDAPLAYQSLDKNGFLIDINPSWEELFGYSNNAVIGKHFSEFLTPNSKQKMQSTFAVFTQKGTISNVKFEIVKQNNTTAWISLNGKLSKKNDANFITHCILTDITQQNAAMWAIKQSENRFKLLSDLSFEAIIIHKDDQVFETNEAFNKIFGYSSQELQKGNIFDKIIHPNYKTIVHKYLEWEYSPPYEITGLNKKAEKLLLEVESKRLRYKNNFLMVTAFRNIEKRAMVEENLRFFHTAVEQSANLIIITDTNGNVQYTNHRFTEITGYKSEEIIGKNPRILKSEKHSKQFYQKLWQTISSGEVWKGEICNRKKTGELYWESAVITPVFDQQRETIGYIAIKEDISYKKDNEQKLLNAIIETEEKERKRFAEDLHDELGPFLSGINLYINELGYEDVNLEKRKSLIEYLKHFVNEAVNKTRSISHQLMPSMLTEYGLKVALESFCNKISITNKITIELKIDNNIKLNNKMHEVAIYRIAIELINNTLKHANASNILIQINTEFNQLVFAYHDNGEGFNLQEKLSNKGGLGLRNMINRLESLKGSFTFENLDKKGVLYRFTLPIE